jgi:large subunit ribosomal protein L32e
MRTRPKFMTQDSHKKKKVSKRWRRPRGLHSKMRLKLKGYRVCVSVGYRSAKATRYSHKKGLKEIFVQTIKDLEGIDKKKEGIIIKSSVGMRKKLLILKEAQKHGIKILNIVDPAAMVKKVEEAHQQKKLKKEAAKEPAKAKKGDKAAEKEAPVEEIDKKEADKKEMDKLLTKKEM